MALKIDRKFIAAKANVSVATVSYVLNNVPHARVGEKTRKKILALAEKYNYFPNLMARSLVMNRTFNIGFISMQTLFGFLKDPFQYAIFTGIETEIEKSGYNLSFSLLQSMEKINSTVRRMIYGHIVDGIIWYGRIEKHFLEMLLKNRTKFVLVDYCPAGIATHCILPENEHGAKEATEYLITKGKKSITCINSDLDHPSYREREKGYRESMGKAGLTPVVGYCGAYYEEARQWVSGNFSRDNLPEAFIVTGENMALGTLHALRGKGIRIPEDVLLIGFDNTDMAAAEKLTTVNVPKFEMGQEGVKRLLERMKKDPPPGIIRLQTNLVIRETA